MSMIIDVHYHSIPYLSEEAIKRYGIGLLHWARLLGHDPDEASIIKKCREIMVDPTGEKLIAHMDDTGIDLTMICAVDNSDEKSITAEKMQDYNKILTDICNRYPKRVLALAGVDPRRPEAPDMLKQCFEEFGVIGLKYHPDIGYFPAGPESYRLLEIVDRHKGILLTHCAPIRPPRRPKFSEDALLLSDIGIDFPNIKVIAAHMGMANWRPWANLASNQPNFYGDMAAWDILALRHYELFCRELRDLIDLSDINKVLFGSDSPFFDVVRPIKNYVTLIRELPNKAPDGIKFTEAEVSAILGGNAASLLGFESSDSAR
ncbi:amidohydrolase family protein [Thermodesulfobacteriota bacterium]